MEKARFPPRWTWLFPLVYGVHLLDEYFTSTGLAVWSTQQFGITFTEAAWLAVNVPSLTLLIGSTWLAVRGTWPAWVVVALATHVAMHAIMHLAVSAWAGSWSPGLLSGLVACLPLALVTFATARGVLLRQQIVRGVFVGGVSFQPLWHAAILPFIGW